MWGITLRSTNGVDVTVSQRPSFHEFISSRLFNQSKVSEESQKQILMELGRIRNDVLKEHQWFKEGSVVRYSDEENRVEAMRKRLLFLFIRDLTSGVGGSIIENKDSRDNVSISKVSQSTKICSWVFVVLLNLGLLFYVYLFAVSQTHSRQSAWFMSFMMWLFFEIVVSSTGVVIVTHLLIPLYVLSDIRNIKKQVLSDILKYRKAVLQKSSRNMVQGNQQQNQLGEEEESTNQQQFNAAKFMFRSWRVASLFPDLKESGLILRFSTPWPNQSFKTTKKDLSNSYKRKYSFISQAVSRIVIFFLATLIHLPHIAQDSIIQRCPTQVWVMLDCCSFDCST